MIDINFEMGKKRSRQQQSSQLPVAAADSSESGDGATDKISTNKQSCSHIAKSIDGNQIKKNISLYITGKKLCPHCKEGNEDDINKSVEGSEDFWICLRCGAKTCSLQHSSAHYDVPRSDSHALTLRIPAFTVWCHACKADIPSGFTKKLKTCVSSVEQLYNKEINLQPLPSQESKNSSNSTEEINDNKGTKLNEPIPLPPPPKTPVSAAPAVRGLTNLGNTCFFNSVLQCLAQTPGLVEALRQMELPDQQVNIVLRSGATLAGELGQWDSFSECLVDTLVKLQSGGPVLTPDRLHSLLTKTQTQFQGYRQHDAHELFTYLIDSVRMTDHKRYRKLILSLFGLFGKIDRQEVPEETTKKLKALDHEVAETITFAPEKVFKGRLVNRIECQECRSVKTFEESFLDLSLPIVPDKPQPPCMRRKGGHQQYHQNQSHLSESVQEENKNNNNNGTRQTMSKSQLKKERRLQKMMNRNQAKSNNNNSNEKDSKKEESDSPPALVEDPLTKDVKKNHEEHQDSDVEGDVEDNSEETNCGSKGSNPAKDNELTTEVAVNSSEVNCGNQGVWFDSNGPSSGATMKDNIEKQETECIVNTTSQKEQESLIEDLLGVQKETRKECKDCPEIKEFFDKKENPSALCSLRLQDNDLEQNLASDEQKRDCDAQVTAWLNTSNLITNPEVDEGTRELTPPITHITSEGDVSGGVISQNRLSPQIHTSICSNHHSSHPSLDDTRSSLLRTATQETQESGYCSEKLGCPESPQRDGSPSSLDRFSPASSGVEGATSSRSEISIEEVLNNTTTAITEEDESVETTEVAVLPFNEILTSENGAPKITYPKKGGSWMRSCHPPAHVRRRPPSPPAVQNVTVQEAECSSTVESAAMCCKWVEESTKMPTFDEKTEMPMDIPFTDKAELEDDIYEPALDDIPEEEVTNFDVVYGPLNKDQMVLGDLEESDNSNELASATQGLIARPGSPCDDSNEPSDLKNLEFTFNEETIPPVHEVEEQLVEKEADQNSGRGSEALNARNAGGDKESGESGCGCNRVSKQDSADSCCLHTSLAQSTQAELMTGCNKIACDTCSSGNPDGKSVYTNSTKQMLISQAPPALVIHLKRFQVQMMTCRKLCRHVSFPLQLDLTPYSVPSASVQKNTEGTKKADDNKSDLLYTLYGLVEHSGTMNGGHYVAYVKICRDSTNLWYCISDSHVSLVSEARVLSAQAYLLFYKRINNT
ncbi:ubiquitin specific protease 16/45 isoform X3 [Rhodnius prolixus]|uniref:ubiquitin specific protease 16/45 isoform X3 n=1 Tax=Rhodnius prolixus TaxID=13249 RepID=UPI003D18EB58